MTTPIPAHLSLAFERRLGALADARLDAVPASDVAQMWNAARVPLAYLPTLAWSLSLDSWVSGDLEARRRSAAAGAVEAHRAKGTEAGVRRVLDDMGIAHTYEERPAGVPYTARVRLHDHGGGTVTDADIIERLHQTRRAAVVMDAVREHATPHPLPVVVTATVTATAVAPLVTLRGP